MLNNSEYCNYEFDIELWKDSYIDLENCPYCIHNRLRTCPTNIYNDTIIEFKKEVR